MVGVKMNWLSVNNILHNSFIIYYLQQLRLSMNNNFRSQIIVSHLLNTIQQQVWKKIDLKNLNKMALQSCQKGSQQIISSCIDLQEINPSKKKTSINFEQSSAKQFLGDHWRTNNVPLLIKGFYESCKVKTQPDQRKKSSKIKMMVNKSEMIKYIDKKKYKKQLFNDSLNNNENEESEDTLKIKNLKSKNFQQQQLELTGLKSNQKASQFENKSLLEKIRKTRSYTHDFSGSVLNIKQKQFKNHTVNTLQYKPISNNVFTKNIPKKPSQNIKNRSYKYCLKQENPQIDNKQISSQVLLLERANFECGVTIKASNKTHCKSFYDGKNKYEGMNLGQFKKTIKFKQFKPFLKQISKPEERMKSQTLSVKIPAQNQTYNKVTLQKSRFQLEKEFKTIELSTKKKPYINSKKYSKLFFNTRKRQERIVVNSSQLFQEFLQQSCK